MKNKKIFYVLFFGSVWGITEATLGYLLHYVSFFIPGVSAFIMFPIAFYIMSKLYNETNNKNLIFLSASLAGTIKLFDLFLPLPSPLKAINPAISIFLEGVFIYVFYLFYEKKKGVLNLSGILLISFSWRIIFFGMLLIQYFFNIPHYLINAGFFAIIKFLVIDSLINAFLIFLYKKNKNFKEKRIFLNRITVTPLSSIVFLCIAISSELLVKIIS